MELITAFGAPHVALALVIGAVLVRFLWWMLADFILAAVDIPFREPLARRGSDAAPERVPGPDDAQAARA